MRQCACVSAAHPHCTRSGRPFLTSYYVTRRLRRDPDGLLSIFTVILRAGQLLFASNALGLGNYNLGASSCLILSLTHSLCRSPSLLDLVDRRTQYRRPPQYVAVVASALFATRRSVSRSHDFTIVRECV